MFPLQTDSLPTNAADLGAEIEKSLRLILQPSAGDMVAVEDRDYPELEAIRISLDGAAAGDRLPPRLTVPAGAVEPALQVAHFEVSGKPVRVQGAPINLNCRARAVTLEQGRDAEGKVMLLLRDAAEGQIEISLGVAELEALVRRGATVAAQKQGVILEDVQMQLTSRTDRALDAVVQVRARKLFLSASVRVSGSLEIDEQLQARLSGLTCAGEGTLGTLACGFLGPHLQRLEARDFSLMALPMGEVKLHDVRIAAGKELRLTAQFGRASA